MPAKSPATSTSSSDPQPACVHSLRCWTSPSTSRGCLQRAGSPLTRSLYRGLLPLLKGRIKNANGITGDFAIAEAERLLTTNMQSIAKLTGKEGYLAGDSFSIADLTAAALIAPLIDPPHPDMKKPSPMPERLAELTEKWRNHAAGRWALEIYERHRPIVGRSSASRS